MTKNIRSRLKATSALESADRKTMNKSFNVKLTRSYKYPTLKERTCKFSSQPQKWLSQKLLLRAEVTLPSACLRGAMPLRILMILMRCFCETSKRKENISVRRIAAAQPCHLDFSYFALYTYMYIKQAFLIFSKIPDQFYHWNLPVVHW